MAHAQPGLRTPDGSWLAPVLRRRTVRRPPMFHITDAHYNQPAQQQTQQGRPQPPWIPAAPPHVLNVV